MIDDWQWPNQLGELKLAVIKPILLANSMSVQPVVGLFDDV